LQNLQNSSAANVAEAAHEDGRHLRAAELSEVEISFGIARRGREGAFTVRQRDYMLAALVRDVPALVLVELTPEVAADARALLLRHRLRSGDAVQLASCVYLQRHLAQPVSFVAFDRRLVETARAEGLTVLTTRAGAPAEKGSEGRQEYT
jgi:uncharacterized protein